MDYLMRNDDSDWKGLTLQNLTAMLNEKIPTYLDVVELDLLGVEPDDQFEESIPAATIGARLGLVLAPFELDFAIRDGILVITSRDYLDSEPSVWIYDVGKIVGKPRISSASQLTSDSLLQVVQQNVDPDSWLSAGGTNGFEYHSTPHRTFLIVSAPMSTQLKITGLLNVLHKSEPIGAVVHSGSRVNRFSEKFDRRLARPHLNLSRSVQTRN